MFTALPRVRGHFRSRGPVRNEVSGSKTTNHAWLRSSYMCHRQVFILHVHKSLFHCGFKFFFMALHPFYLPFNVLFAPVCLNITPIIAAWESLQGPWCYYLQCEWNIFFLWGRRLYMQLVFLRILRAIILSISVTASVLRTLFFSLYFTVHSSHHQLSTEMRSHLVNTV